MLNGTIVTYMMIQQGNKTHVVSASEKRYNFFFFSNHTLYRVVVSP